MEKERGPYSLIINVCLWKVKREGWGGEGSVDK